jgi:bacillithiol biosynthesis deacetylase BshB1
MKILVLGIHPDDVELGCGGTVILAGDQGHSVVVADLSEGAASSNGTVDERKAEAQAAGAIMGIDERINLGLPDTGIESEDAEQLARVVACIRRVRPQLALVPSSDDAHPDHRAGGDLVRRALYFAGVHGFTPGRGEDRVHRIPNVLIYQGRSEVRADLVVDITQTFERKIEAIKAHASQFTAASGSRPTPINSSEFLPFVEARCRVYGRQIGVRYGEPFSAPSPLALSGFDLFEA